MDTSQHYIEMCRKATDLQSGWKPLGSDFAYFNGDITLVAWNEAVFDAIRTNVVNKTGEVVWLPKLDQLIEMIKTDIKLIRDNDRFSVCLYDGRRHDFVGDSFEKALLLAIMDRYYNKTWNGKDWA
ncbi:MAG: hypothetical protein CV087_07430 [Candidatus Brocadia sp. WS118]|nr:MAG: hypothetical protein CV087_07430 [Candidatus Brocadia sp. WS118]